MGLFLDPTQSAQSSEVTRFHFRKIYESGGYSGFGTFFVQFYEVPVARFEPSDLPCD